MTSEDLMWHIAN